MSQNRHRPSVEMSLEDWRGTIAESPGKKAVITSSPLYFERLMGVLLSNPQQLMDDELTFLLADLRAQLELKDPTETCQTLCDLAGWTLLSRAPDLPSTLLIIEYCREGMEQRARKYGQKFPDFAAAAGTRQVVSLVPRAHLLPGT